MTTKPGPKPKPTVLKLLEGNPGKRPLNENEPRYDAVDPDIKPPAHLNRWGKLEWKRLAPLLAERGLLTEADIGTFEMLCHSYGTWRKNLSALRGKADTIQTQSGYRQQAPEVGIAANAQAAYVKLGSLFGLNPSDRGRLNLPGHSAGEEESPMRQALREARALQR